MQCNILVCVYLDSSQKWNKNVIATNMYDVYM